MKIIQPLVYAVLISIGIFIGNISNSENKTTKCECPETKCDTQQNTGEILKPKQKKK